MKKEELKEWLEKRKENLKGGMNDISIGFASDYDINTSSYLCDLFTEYADSQVDMMNYDLIEWFRYNYEYVEQAVAEFGVDEKNFDIFRLFQSGQYLQNSELLSQDEQEIVELMVVNYLLENEEEIEKELEESELEEMFDEIESQFDNCERLENLIDIIDEYIKIKDEDDEE